MATAPRPKPPALLRAERALCGGERGDVRAAKRLFERAGRGEQRSALARDALAYYGQFLDPGHPLHAVSMGEIGSLVAAMEAACMFQTLGEMYRQEGGVPAAQRVVKQWEMLFVSSLVRGYGREVEYMAPDLRRQLQEMAAPQMSPVDDRYTGVKLVVLPDGTVSLSPLPTPQMEALIAASTPAGMGVPDGSIVDVHRDPSTSYLDALLFRFREPNVAEKLLEHCPPMQNNAVWALRNISEEEHLLRLLPRMFARGQMYFTPLFVTSISDQQRVEILVERGRMSRIRRRFRSLPLPDQDVDKPRFLRTLYSFCAGCGAAMAKLVCSRCREVNYCGAACQRRDWPRHKADCAMEM